MDIDLLSFSEAKDNFSFLWSFGLLIFYFFTEMLDSSLTFSLTQHRSVQSAVVTFVLYLTLAIEIGAIVTNYLYVFPIAIGAALGSYVIVEHEKRVRPKDK